MQKALLTVELPGQDSPSMQLFDDMMVLAPGPGPDRADVIALLIEALAILSPPNPRHAHARDFKGSDGGPLPGRHLKLV